MATVNAYINFQGNCEEAFTMLSRFSEMPPQDGMDLSEKDISKYIIETYVRVKESGN